MKLKLSGGYGDWSPKRFGTSDDLSTTADSDQAGDDKRSEEGSDYIDFHFEAQPRAEEIPMPRFGGSKGRQSAKIGFSFCGGGSR